LALYLLNLQFATNVACREFIGNQYGHLAGTKLALKIKKIRKKLVKYKEPIL